ncbi:MAG: hypothetical protein AAGF06_02540 [Pseudomonadota bacterium]
MRIWLMKERLKGVSTGGLKGLLMCVGLSVSVAGSAETGTVKSVCKGVSETQCQSSVQCRWINGFERSDGIVVKSYCRKGAKRKQTKRAEGDAVKRRVSATPVISSTTRRSVSTSKSVQPIANDEGAKERPTTLSSKLKSLMFDD